MDIELVTDPYACMMYRVTTCRPGRRHILAASRLQLVDAEQTALLMRWSKLYLCSSNFLNFIIVLYCMNFFSI